MLLPHPFERSCVVFHKRLNSHECRGMPTANGLLRGPLHTFHNLLHFLPFPELGQQDSAFTKSHLLCNGLELSVVLRSVLAQDDGPA
jgi:hypothetical protein